MRNGPWSAPTPLSRTWTVVARGGAGLLVVLAIVSLVSANHVYNLSGRWFSRATNIAQCMPGAIPPPPSRCAHLQVEPQPPAIDGVQVTDRDVLLAEGATLNNDGTALITIAGVLLAAAALTLTLSEVGRRGGRGETPSQTRDSPLGGVPSRDGRAR